MSEVIKIFKTGYVAIAGPTNSGKSTLLNALVGEKVSIVSPRPQTTYHGVRGIVTRENYQMVFVDTPGLQNYRARVAQLLNRVSDRNVSVAEITLWVFDVAEESFSRKFERLAKRVGQSGTPQNRILILNKIDKIAKLKLLPLLEWLHSLNLFSAIIPISARKADGLEAVLLEVEKRLPEGQAMFPESVKSDRTLQFQITEWVREQAYHRLYEELPYSLWVELERWEESDNDVKAYATIHVDGRSKKGMVIGKKGAKLKEIGTYARQSFEKKLGKKFSLFLNVDYQPDWQRDRNGLQRYLEL